MCRVAEICAKAGISQDLHRLEEEVWSADTELGYPSLFSNSNRSRSYMPIRRCRWRRIICTTRKAMADGAHKRMKRPRNHPKPLSPCECSPR